MEYSFLPHPPNLALLFGLSSIQIAVFNPWSDNFFKLLWFINEFGSIRSTPATATVRTLASGSLMASISALVDSGVALLLNPRQLLYAYLHLDRASKT
jgi:hypothetical protein